MIDPQTPVVVGVGEYSERVNDDNYMGLSPVQLAVKAAENACNDALSTEVLAPQIDTLGAVRTFEDTSPKLAGPFGKSNNFPGSIAKHLGAKPNKLIWEVSGGQSPQKLLAEMCATIAAGDAEVCLIAGGEAISTVRHLASQGQKVDWSETVDAEVDDRGPGLKGVGGTSDAMRHGLIGAPPLYAMLENARRAREGISREDYLQAMGELFAPFTGVATNNPHSMSHAKLSARDVATVTEANRMIADPYPRYVVARDQVNQAAAVVITSVAKARELGIDESQWVYLHGHASLMEKPTFERPDLSCSPAAHLATQTALDMAGITMSEVAFIDLYSCFPVPVFNICDAFDIAPNDPRGLTVVGGLPFFGGAGNNYSMHGIASTVRLVRNKPGSFGFVGANGGTMTKYATGIYSTTPKAFSVTNNKALQKTLDAVPSASLCYSPEGEATIETFTIIYKKGQPAMGVVAGRLASTGERFIANTDPKDSNGLNGLLIGEPIGKDIWVTTTPKGNRVYFDKVTMAQYNPDIEPAFLDSYEFFLVERKGRVLEITINRPEARNCLHSPSHLELAGIFDAYYADNELWVAILTGAGSDAFCAGNDLKYTASGKPSYMPASGFGGLVLRRNRNKPIIVAVNGYAMGGGLEICLASDIVVVDSKAQLALSEVKVGVFAAAGGLVRLPRQIPEKIAKEMILTGRRIGAEECVKLGLASRIAPDGEAMAVAREIAAEIVDGSPTSVRLSMEVMNEASKIADVEEAVNHHYSALDDLIISQDMTEGMTAFAQKRKPQWKNR